MALQEILIDRKQLRTIEIINQKILATGARNGSKEETMVRIKATTRRTCHKVFFITLTNSTSEYIKIIINNIYYY